MLSSQRHKEFVKLIDLQAIHLKGMEKPDSQELASKELATNAQNAQNMQLKELETSN